MKRYYYTSVEKSKRNTTEVSGKIYKIVKNELKYICDYDFSTASCRGNVHEVFNSLINYGEIPKKYYKSSECNWSSGGYFQGVVTEKYIIERI